MSGDKFNAKDALADYVTVPQRIAQFYELFGQGRLVTGEVRLTSEPDGKPRVMVQAAAYRSPDDTLPGIGWSWMELPGKTAFTLGSELENTETSAWGRAIAALGILVDRSVASANEVKTKAAEVPVRAEADAEPSYAVGEWSVVGKAEPGANSPVDGELRETPEGWIFGFVIEAADKKRFQVVAEGPLALPVSLVWESLNGQEVRASGPTELVPWSKKVNGKERAMPPYRRIHAERIESAEIVIPSATEPPTMALFPDDEAELDAALERVP